ncbi:MAG: SPOR domain-containing protein [Bryobacteraceae bacterium]
MLRTSESETEILLGNKQLLGIFFVIAVLLGIAFTGGYMVGRGSGDKKAAAVILPAGPTTPVTRNPPAGETHSVGAAPNPDESQPVGAADQPVDIPATGKGVASTEDAPLGSPRRKEHEAKTEAREQEPVPVNTDSGAAWAPEPGQTFLQVAATTRDEAEAVADVLQKKGFRAHAVPKPGNPKLYRILIGPVRDAGDLSNTREALRDKAGFREVIVQKY